MGNRIKVKFFADLRSLAKRDFIEIEVEGSLKLRDLLREVSSKVGLPLEDKLLDGEKIRSGFMVLINGRNALYLNGASTLIDGGEVALFPPAGGG